MTSTPTARGALTGRLLAAAAVGATAAALLPGGVSGAAPAGTTATPSSGAVGTRIAVRATCSGDLAGGRWLPAQVGLYYADAFRRMEAYDTFAVTTSRTSAAGAVVATITVPAKAEYTRAAPGNPDMPADDVVRNVTGQVGVQVLCFNSQSANPWQIITKPKAFTVLLPILGRTAVPRVTGVAKVGRTLTASPGTWRPAATRISYQWRRNGKAIRGAVARTYKVKALDKGRKLSVVVTASRPGYRPGIATSAAKTVG